MGDTIRVLGGRRRLVSTAFDTSGGSTQESGRAKEETGHLDKRQN